MRHRPPALLIAIVILAFAHLAGCGASPVGEPTAISTQSLVTCPGGQTLATFQRGSTSPGPVADTSINSASPTSNSGANTAINIGGTRSVLLRFDVSTLPSGATVQSAVMGLTNNLAPTAGTVLAEANSAAWVESTVTYATAPAFGASIASNGNSGGAGSAYTMTLPTAAVQGWITGSNYGLRLDESSGTTNIFSSEYSTTANRPRLDVCYTTAAPTCVDGIKNGAETGIDCGGGTCPTCAVGIGCSVAADCTSGICTAGLCAAPPSGCTDAIKDGAETDVDCGGPTCSPCATGLGCIIATDCTSDACGLASTCVASPSGTQPTLSALVTGVDAQYGSTATESLTWYAPTGTAPAGGWPVVIDVHGGGFTATGGGRNSAGITYHAQVLNTMGVGLITVDYLLTASGGVNPFPVAVNDLRAVACWIRSNASLYSIDVSRLGWMGYSAGGGLVGKFATTLGITTDSGGTTYATPACSLAGIVKTWAADYGNVGMVPSEWSASNPNEWWYANSSPVGGTLPSGFLLDAPVTCHTGDPTVYLSDGSADSTVAPAAIRRLAAQCRSVGVTTFDLVIPGGAHGYNPVQWGPAIYLPATWQMLGMAGSL